MNKIALLIAALLLTSCASYGTKVDSNQVAAFTIGKTTYNKVISKFGMLSDTFLDKSIIYGHFESNVKPATFILKLVQVA